MAKVQCFDKNAPIDEVMDTLDRDGAVIYHKLLDADTMDRVRTDLESYIERSCYGEGEFWGFKTKRFGALVAKSRTFAEQVAPNPQILSVMERLLGPYCENGQFQLQRDTADSDRAQRDAPDHAPGRLADAFHSARPTMLLHHDVGADGFHGGQRCHERHPRQPQMDR